MPTITVNLPLVPLTTGDEVVRDRWVPHITLIGNAEATAPDAAVPVVAAFAGRTSAIRAAVGAEAWFGPDGTVLVDELDATALRPLHDELLGELEAAVADFRPLLPRHTRDGWRPHRTVVAGPRPVAGDVLEATTIGLFELDPPGRLGIAVALGVWPLAGVAGSGRRPGCRTSAPDRS
ncbi:2'-5' RNA ligase family protein [Amnibacterium kyonggiense]|uniref:2'-5' RNA ligase superfamily protein n=1 Tax=Amnibacterium kyonggiense TaxID=595671 RepID=A0A4R7FHJ9_9MICO|nr:2'-5' RNA ligase family protein [Amnibacterium kyonggiense]TDS75714.1 2'-5' RNA ligase superfamily protein [Amnibacterium kyonggiense]